MVLALSTAALIDSNAAAATSGPAACPAGPACPARRTLGEAGAAVAQVDVAAGAAGEKGLWPLPSRMLPAAALE